MKNIYNKDIVNYNEFVIDSLPLRKKVNSKKIYYTNACSRKCKSMHITLDAYDQARCLRTMAMHDLPQKEITCYYYLDIENKKVRKLKEVVRYYRKHNLTINSELVYHGKKSQAMKKLEMLIA